MDHKPPRTDPALSGNLLENRPKRGPSDCIAHGFARIGGKTYSVNLYEAGYARGESSKKRWRLTFMPKDEQGS